MNMQIDRGRFDYAAIEAATVANIRGMADRIRQARRMTATMIAAIGAELIAAKSLLPHGAFGPWLVAELDWSERTARRFMDVARVFNGKTDTVAVLPPTSLYLLARQSTPQQVRDEIIARLERGEPIDDSDVATSIRAARAAATGTQQSRPSDAAQVPALVTPELDPPPVDHFEIAAHLIAEIDSEIQHVPRCDRAAVAMRAAELLKERNRFEAVDRTSVDSPSIAVWFKPGR